MILLAPFLIIGYIWWRLSKRARRRGHGRGAGGGAVQGQGVRRRSGRTPPSPTWPATTGPRPRSPRWSTSCRTRGATPRPGPWRPRGILMVGPPGTGKTLLARAVAGEASVPFFSVTGSSFVEMFVGVGAARVRDLFAEARKRAPAIIFVDEIDAIGQRRGGAGAVVSNDEREQTLNQLLAEMDGFDPADGHRRAGRHQPARGPGPRPAAPGRFDRQVTVPLPNAGRAPGDPDRPLPGQAAGPRCRPGGGGPGHARVFRGRPGQPGQRGGHRRRARRPRRDLAAADFDEARDRIILGRREGSNVLLPDEKHAVAVHEAGHALVAAYSDKADPVAKVTILPAGQALGVTEQLPLVERHLYGEDYLHDILAVFLGGRAGRAGGAGPGFHRRLQRPGQGDGPGHQDGARVRAVGQPRAGRLPLGGFGLPRRRWRRVLQPPVCRSHPGHHRRRGVTPAARGRATGRSRCSRATSTSSTAWCNCSCPTRRWTGRRSTPWPADLSRRAQRA